MWESEREGRNEECPPKRQLMDRFGKPHNSSFISKLFGKVARGTFFQKEIIKYIFSFHISKLFFTYFILTFLSSMSYLFSFASLGPQVLESMSVFCFHFLNQCSLK